jgi:cobalt-zinc-cadmium efflux system outer membrane protein
MPEAEADTAEIEKHATDSSLELAAARWHIEQAAAEAGLAKSAALIPDAEVGPSVEKESEHGPWETGGAVSVPIPIFDFGQAEKARAMSELRRQRQRYMAVAVRVRAEARRAAAQLMTSRLRAASLGQVIAPLRRKILEQMQLQYNGMLAGPFDLLQARENQNDADARAIEALRDYWLARSRLERIMAGGSASDMGGS